MLVAELGELEQVHAGAGGGQAIQVSPSVVDAEGRVKLLFMSEGLRLETDRDISLHPRVV